MTGTTGCFPKILSRASIESLDNLVILVVREGQSWIAMRIKNFEPELLF